MIRGSNAKGGCLQHVTLHKTAPEIRDTLIYLMTLNAGVVWMCDLRALRLSGRPGRSRAGKLADELQEAHRYRRTLGCLRCIKGRLPLLEVLRLRRTANRIFESLQTYLMNSVDSLAKP